jgi:hypothetical protein
LGDGDGGAAEAALAAAVLEYQAKGATALVERARRLGERSRSALAPIASSSE